MMLMLLLQVSAEDLVGLRRLGADDEMLVAYICHAGANPGLTADDVVALKRAGIGDAAIARALREPVVTFVVRERPYYRFWLGDRHTIYGHGYTRNPFMQNRRLRLYR